MQTYPTHQSSTHEHHSHANLLRLLLRDELIVLVDETLCAQHLERVVQRVELRLRCAVRAKVAVGPGEVLAVVDGEVHVVQGVVGGAVEPLFCPVTLDHVAVVDEDGPDLHGYEERHVEVALHGAEEDEKAGVGLGAHLEVGQRREDVLVGCGLDEAICGVEG